MITKLFEFIITFCWAMMLGLTCCLSADLTLMIKYPFKKKEKRIKWYVLGCLVFSIVLASVCTANIEKT